MNKVLETKRNLDKIISTIGDLPATPAVIATLMNLTSDVNADIEKIIRAIRADQSLTAKVLKMSNSSFYGRAREVKTLREAILILGFMTLHSLVIATSTQGLYQKSTNSRISGKLWEHAFACALASRLIAQEVKYPYVEEAFIAGLLHDIGKLVLSQKAADEYFRIAQKVEATGGAFADAETAAFSFTHADVGSLLLGKWSFPGELIEAVGNHHQFPPPEGAPPAPLVSIIHLGNFTAKKLGVGFTDYRPDNLSSLLSARSLDLDADRLAAVEQKLREHYASEQELFKLKN